jgi:hypothetical protein
VIEFGLKYQFTSLYIYKYIGETFSLAYIPPNLYKTLINPLETFKSFPFVKPIRWPEPAWFAGYNPQIYDYFTEDITGILVGSPFLIFAALANARAQKNARWILGALTGYVALIFFTMLVFFFTAMRYLLELTPALSLLALVGFWQGLRRFQTRRTARSTFAILGMCLWAYTISVSFAISVSGNLHRIKIFNPELVQRLTWTFNHLFK